MVPIFVGVASFLAFMSSAFCGVWLAHRLPETQLTEQNMDLIKESRRIVVAIASFMLGLIIASEISSFRRRSQEIEESASGIVSLDSTLSQYGSESLASRQALRKIVENTISQIDSGAAEWRKDWKNNSSDYETLQSYILEISSKVQQVTWVQLTDMALTLDLIACLRQEYLSNPQRVQWPVVAVLIFLLCFIFVSYGALAPSSGTSFFILTATALFMAIAIFLITDLNTPYRGVIHISSKPLKGALQDIGPMR
jgi:hypothetical protein